MYDFGIDLGASCTKVACLHRAPGELSFADAVFGSPLGTRFVGGTNPYWMPQPHPMINRTFLIPSCLLQDRRSEEPQRMIGQPAWDRYLAIRKDEADHRKAHPEHVRRVAAYPYFNWKRHFLTDSDAQARPEFTVDHRYTWQDLAVDFLAGLREGIAATNVLGAGGRQAATFQVRLQSAGAHTRLCVPLTDYAKRNQAAIEIRIRDVLSLAGWPVQPERRVVSWEGTANLLGRLTRARNQLSGAGIGGVLEPDVEGIFDGLGFCEGAPSEAWTCMAVDVGHYTTDIAVYRFLAGGEEFRNPSAMDNAIFTASKEVGVRDHVDARINEYLREHDAAAQDAAVLEHFKRTWTAAMIDQQPPTTAVQVLGIKNPTEVGQTIQTVQNIYEEFAHQVARGVSHALDDCICDWLPHRPDIARYPNLKVNMVYLSGGVMESPDVRKAVRKALREVPPLSQAEFDNPADDASISARRWSTRLRTACAAGAISVLGDSRP